MPSADLVFKVYVLVCFIYLFYKMSSLEKKIEGVGKGVSKSAETLEEIKERRDATVYQEIIKEIKNKEDLAFLKEKHKISIAELEAIKKLLERVK